MNKPKIVTLANGVRLILAPQKEAPTATALIMVAAGSEYETKEESGLSHFLEHLAFKGTDRYPNPGQISHEFERLGAETNAWTTESHTAYWAKAQSGKAKQIVDIITELHLHPRIAAEEVDKERGVILEELAMYEDRPQRKVMELWQETLYGDQPAGRPIGGTKKSVNKLTREQVVAYRAQRYRGPETVMALTGGFDVGLMQKFLTERLDSIDTRKAAKKTKTKNIQQGESVRFSKKDSDQSHLVLGFRGVPQGHPDEYVLATLATVLGGGMSSRLFMRIREELGAAYYVSTWNDFSLDHGAFATSVGASNSKVEAVVAAIMEEYRRVTTELISPQELQRARDYQIGTFLMGLESSDALAAHYAGDMLLRGKIVSPQETVKGIKQVTAEDIRRVARKFFKEEALVIAGIGPELRKDRFKKLLRV